MEKYEKYEIYLTWNRLGYTKHNDRKGADMIIVSNDNRSLFETLEYYDKEKEYIGGSRYLVQYRRDFPDSLIMVCGKDDINRCGYIILESKDEK